jgi:sugar lactone lactonase YvrE
MNHKTKTLFIALGLLLVGRSAALAAAGDLYDADFNSAAIFKFSPDGARTTFASGLNGPIAVAFDRAGNLYEADYNTGNIFKFTPAGAKAVFASGLKNPFALAFDSAGNLFVAENLTSSFVQDKDIVKITPAGTKTLFAGGLADPRGLAFDSVGNLFVSDGRSPFTIFKFTPTGTKSTFGTPSAFPRGLAFDRAGNLYLAAGSTIEKYAPNGMKTTFGSAPNPVGLAFDAAGNLFVSNDNGTNKILKFAPDGSQSVFVSTFISAPLGLAVEPARGQPINIATRLRVQAGDNALIAGFIVTGTAPKKVLIRGLGPSLASAGVAGSLQDPTIELRNASGAMVNGNNNWRDTQETAIAATGIAPTDNRESAFLINLGAGAWTVVMRGVGNTTGIGVVEVYDLDQTVDSRLANISTRGFVEAGDNVMIGGFFVGSGNGAATLLIRAIGPSLANLGVAGALTDPTLSLRNSNGAQIALNDDWSLVVNGQDSEMRAIQNTGLAPSHEHESAILTTLPNGSYTAIVAGYNGETGVGLVEVYNLR